jgi:hypothetical protein
MEDMDQAKLKNKVVKPKKRVAGKTGSELSSEEERMAEFSTVRSRKKRHVASTASAICGVKPELSRLKPYGNP